MFDLNDTIVAVSSPSMDRRVIVRITGPATLEKISLFFNSALSIDKGGVFSGSINVDDLRIDAKLYLFVTPNSYTGDDVAEIHLNTNQSVVKALMRFLLSNALRIAGPGEFTARAFLNGKMDLAQAEAVGEIVASSNRFQLDAAEKLLGGKLAETTTKVSSQILDCLSLIEAGMDFSGEGIEFITVEQAIGRLAEIKKQLQQLPAGNISDESAIDLPSVGIAGAPNAGKSSLLNKLLGKQRSIVSGQRKTTRDVLTGRLQLKNCQCVVFDCAGLILKPANILDELAQAAAIEALRKSLMVVFCVDVSKDDWQEDILVRELIESEILLAVATKSDLVPQGLLAERLARLSELFGVDFLATSVKTGSGVEILRERIDKEIIKQTIPASEGSANHVALTARHKQHCSEVINNINDSVGELKAGNDEVAAIMLRAGYRAILSIEQPDIDEKILENIFSRFCIGK